MQNLSEGEVENVRLDERSVASAADNPSANSIQKKATNGNFDNGEEKVSCAQDEDGKLLKKDQVGQVFYLTAISCNHVLVLC